MPKVFDWRGYRFHFYAEEGDPREPVHNHVRKGRDNAKFWLHPQVTLAYNRGFPPHVLFAARRCYRAARHFDRKRVE